MESQLAFQITEQIKLPSAAHLRGDKAGSFTDPITKNRVFRLSDRELCPGGGTHLYSWGTPFSAQGRMVVNCDQGSNAPTTYVLYDRDFTLVEVDAARATKAPINIRSLQWSHEKEVLYGAVGPKVLRVDPIAKQSSVYADFSGMGARSIRDLWVGPSDRILVTLQAPGGWNVFAVAYFDSTNRKYGVWDLSKDPNGRAFHQATFTENPEGRVVIVYNKTQRIFDLAFESSVEFADTSHLGFLSLSNGKYGIVKNHGACSGVGFWKWQYALVDDVTGDVLAMFGCDVPGQHEWAHWSRSIKLKDVFSVTTDRYTFPPSRERQPTYESVLLAKVVYQNNAPRTVQVTPIAYHRSAAGARAKALGRHCGYWAWPRGSLDHTGTRVLFDSTMSHPEWPSQDTDGRTKTDCRVDVYVVVTGDKP
jgi:hypothetical protein